MTEATVKTNKSGRKRRTLGWTLLTFGLLAACGCVASGFVGVSRTDGGGCFSIARGIVEYQATSGIPSKPAWSCRWYGLSEARWRWATEPFDDVLWTTTWNYRLIAKQESKPFPGRAPFGYHGWSAVLWPIPFLICTPAALLLRSGILARRRAITGLCGKCGYNLAGLAPNVPCPECSNQQPPILSSD